MWQTRIVVFSLVVLFFGALAAKYFEFAYQGMVARNVPRYRERAFDVAEMSGDEAYRWGVKQLVIALAILGFTAFLLYVLHRYLDDDV